MNEKDDCLPAEKTDIFISGYNLSLAQFTVFRLMDLSENDQRKVVDIYLDGKKNRLPTYQIKQNLFGKINGDTDFLIDIMKTDFYFQEKDVLEKYLNDWVNESEDPELLFKFEYFNKHPEIKNHLLSGS